MQFCNSNLEIFQLLTKEQQLDIFKFQADTIYQISFQYLYVHATSAKNTNGNC